MSQGPQMEVPYPPTNRGQQRLGTPVAFVHPSVTWILLCGRKFENKQIFNLKSSMFNAN